MSKCHDYTSVNIHTYLFKKVVLVIDIRFYNQNRYFLSAVMLQVALNSFYIYHIDSILSKIHKMVIYVTLIRRFMPHKFE